MNKLEENNNKLFKDLDYDINNIKHFLSYIVNDEYRASFLYDDIIYVFKDDRISRFNLDSEDPDVYTLLQMLVRNHALFDYVLTNSNYAKGPGGFNLKRHLHLENVSKIGDLYVLELPNYKVYQKEDKQSEFRVEIAKDVDYKILKRQFNNKSVYQIFSIFVRDLDCSNLLDDVIKNFNEIEDISSEEKNNIEKNKIQLHTDLMQKLKDV